MRTTFTREIDGVVDIRTVSAQIFTESDTKMRFPKVIENKRGNRVTIYGKTLKNDSYRLNYWSGGKRQQPNFQTYSAALKKAKSALRDMASRRACLGSVAQPSERRNKSRV